MSKFIEITDNSGCEILLNTAHIYEVLPETDGASVHLTIKDNNGLQLVVETATAYEELRRLLTGE